MTSLLAKLIAKEEGFGRPGAVPTVRHNPGDLRHSPHSTHPVDQPDAIGTIDSDVDGWTDLERQLMLYAERGMTLRQVIEVYAPPSDNNNTARYLADICVGLVADRLVSDILTFPQPSGADVVSVPDGSK